MALKSRMRKRNARIRELLADNLKVVVNKVVGLRRSVKIATQYKHNAVNLRIQLVRLQEMRDRLQQGIRDARKNAKEIHYEAKEWLKKVNTALEDGNEVLANLKPCSFQLGHKAVSLAEHASVLSAALLRTNLKDFSWNSSFGEIMKAMEDANFQMIGIWGLCGVGTTTLAKRVASEAEEDKLFDVVLMVTVPPNQDEIQIQQLLADRLGLKFSENDKTERRAIQLYERIRKEHRILVIIDHVEDEINLEKLGLPTGDDHKGCRILLTSETCDVLTTKMGAQKVVQVDKLSNDERWDLFVKMGGDVVAQDSDLQSKARNIIVHQLDRCPLLIAPLVKALRNKHVSEWNATLASWLDEDKLLLYQVQETMMEHLQKTYGGWWGKRQCQVICSTLMICYDHLKSEEAKLLFLLIGWIGSSFVSKYHLFLLGMGFGLFNRVDALDNGRNKLQELIDELKDTYLLIEDQEDSVRMHEVICEGAIAILSTPELEVISQKIDSKIDELWLDLSCHLIFMPSFSSRYLPKMLNTPKLQVLIIGLDNDMKFLEIPKSYFERMENLKVLHLRGHFIFPSLLPSLDFLKSLTVLSLFGCHLTDATILSQLTNLEVLSLNGSNIQILVKEFGKLLRLRLLDLENSNIREIVPGVISKLESLEELYLGGTNICWGVKDKNNESTKASLNELGALNRLATLDITVQDVQVWPTNLFFKCPLKFRILLGDLWLWDGKDIHQTLKLQHCRSIHLDQGMKALLKLVEHLVMDGTPSFKNVMYDFNVEGFPELKYLIVDEPAYSSFPNLISLVLQHLNNLECICNGPLTINPFCKLRIIKVKCCNGMKNLLSFSMIKIIPQLVEIEVSKCESMEEIILLKEENVSQPDSCIEFSCLQSLVVHNLPMLIGFCTKEVKSSSSMPQRSFDKQMERQILNEIIEEHSSISFFNEKVAFPRLDTLHLSLLSFDNFWGDQIFGANSITQNLTKLTIEELNSLKYLFSISMLRCLKKLRHLMIKNCVMMEDIFFNDETIDETNNHMRDGSNEKIFFPNLKTMIVHSMENLRAMWHSQLATPYSFCKLKTIKIKNCPQLIPVFPTYILNNLNSLLDLSVDNCNLLEDTANLPEPDADKSMAVFDEQSYQEQPSKSFFRDVYCSIEKACCMCENA